MYCTTTTCLEDSTPHSFPVVLSPTSLSRNNHNNSNNNTVITLSSTFSTPRSTPRSSIHSHCDSSKSGSNSSTPTSKSNSFYSRNNNTICTIFTLATANSSGYNNDWLYSPLSSPTNTSTTASLKIGSNSIPFYQSTTPILSESNNPIELENIMGSAVSSLSSSSSSCKEMSGSSSGSSGHGFTGGVFSPALKKTVSMPTMNTTMRSTTMMSVSVTVNVREDYSRKQQEFIQKRQFREREREKERDRLENEEREREITQRKPEFRNLGTTISPDVEEISAEYVSSSDEKSPNAAKSRLSVANAQPIQPGQLLPVQRSQRFYAVQDNNDTNSDASTSKRIYVNEMIDSTSDMNTITMSSPVNLDGTNSDQPSLPLPVGGIRPTGINLGAKLGLGLMISTNNTNNNNLNSQSSLHSILSDCSMRGDTPPVNINSHEENGTGSSSRTPTDSLSGPTTTSTLGGLSALLKINTELTDSSADFNLLKEMSGSSVGGEIHGTEAVYEYEKAMNKASPMYTLNTTSLNVNSKTSPMKKSPLIPKVCFVFDFDCTISSKHVYHFINGYTNYIRNFYLPSLSNHHKPCHDDQMLHQLQQCEMMLQQQVVNSNPGRFSQRMTPPPNSTHSTPDGKSDTIVVSQSSSRNVSRDAKDSSPSSSGPLKVDEERASVRVSSPSTSGKHNKTTTETSIRSGHHRSSSTGHIQLPPATTSTTTTSPLTTSASTESFYVKRLQKISNKLKLEQLLTDDERETFIQETFDGEERLLMLRTFFEELKLNKKFKLLIASKGNKRQILHNLKILKLDHIFEERHVYDYNTSKKHLLAKLLMKQYNVVYFDDSSDDHKHLYQKQMHLSKLPAASSDNFDVFESVTGTNYIFCKSLPHNGNGISQELVNVVMKEMEQRKWFTIPSTHSLSNTPRTMESEHTMDR